MDLYVYFLFGVLSILTEFSFTGYIVFYYRKREWNNRTFSALTMYTIGIFATVLILFLPIYYCGYDFGDGYAWGRPFWLALHNTMRVFILDGEFDTVKNAIANLPLKLRIVLSVHAAVLYVLAPVLTFGNVLSLFKNFRAKLQFKFFCRNRPLYVMSELNSASLALAHSICTSRKEREPRLKLVFADVYPELAEQQYELFSEACSIGAICLQQDVSSLNFEAKRGNTEIFMIGDDESENVAQTVKLLSKLNQTPQHQNIKLFTFAESDASGHTLESQNTDALLDEASRKNFDEHTFKLRRINKYRQLVWNTVPEMRLAARSRNHIISVLLVGFGSYGQEFFKMILWYCQLEGYTLEINILDVKNPDSRGRGGIDSVLRRECPELMKKNPCFDDGDANYSIRILDGIDIETADLADLMKESPEVEKRLKHTTHVVVALGEDDKNIEAAIYLRTIFDRLNGVAASRQIKDSEECPDIYAIVYNEQKSKLVRNTDTNCGQAFVNHQKIPYHIHLIGSIVDQYNIDNLYNPQLEKEGYHNHVSWADVNRKAAEELRQQGKSEEEIEENGYSYYDIDLNAELRKYERFEYFRNASISKVIIQRMLNESQLAEQMKCSYGHRSVLCQCPGCTLRKKTEHRRWNAYMRVNGFCHSRKRADRALYHNDLVPWNELDENERIKD